MSAETVIKKIQDKAAAEVEAIANAGKAEAEALRNSIMAEAQEKADAITGRGASQAELILRGGVQEAELDNRISYLNTKHDLLDKAKEAAKKMLMNLSDKDWGELFTKLISQYAMNGAVTVKASQRDLPKFKSKTFCADNFGGKKSLIFRDKLLGDYWSKLLSDERNEKVSVSVSDEPADIDGGVILCGDEYDIDLSYDAILDEIFEQNEKEIADSLFGRK
jgi:vacuolar-type H+-ATPase subunit E/Vma4